MVDSSGGASVEWAECWPADQREKVRDAVAQARSGQVARFRGQCPTATGALCWWDVVVSPVAGAGPGARRALIAVSRDVTALLDADHKTSQSQRLEAVGRLTGGVAHDFNNLLTVMMGVSEALAIGLQPQSELQKLALVGMQTAERGAELVRRLLAFSGGQELEPQTLECSGTVNAVGSFVRYTLRDDIALALDAPAALFCRADQPGLESALLNLCINARDAMPAGGTLTLKAEAEVLSAPAAEALGLQAGRYVAFSVEDTGVGMTPAVLNRAVEPFFTTKAASGGSGLGLSSVYGFARQSHGALAIASHEGEGSSFKIYLPRAERSEDQQPGPTSRAPNAVDEHVLLVEDDTLVRMQAARLLSQTGYQVTPVADGPAALGVLSDAVPVDLLMTNLVMPGALNGRDLAEAARALQPGLKVLFSSGCAQSARSLTGRRDPSLHILAKPYRQAELALAVAAAIGQPKPRAARSGRP